MHVIKDVIRFNNTSEQDDTLNYGGCALINKPTIYQMTDNDKLKQALVKASGV